jgi:fucose 4-O-acetylase-like acetyltransferase
LSDPRPQPLAVRTLVALTPPDRDRYVDLLRAASITVVVFGHWLISVVVRDGDELTATSALAAVHPLQLATWLLQVMPVFFFVGGFSNLLAIRHEAAHGGRYRNYLRRRMARLLGPTVLFASVWIIAAEVVARTGISSSSLRFVTRLPAQPLWFLAVYVVVVALAPPMAYVHRRWPVVPFVVLPVAVVVFDQLGLRWDLGGPAMANYVLVFLFAQQLGFLYGDGWLTARPNRVLLGASAVALGALVLLTTVGAYPVSMVGVPGESMSNMSPPTLCILVLAVAQVGLLMALRAPANRWLQRRRPWTVTVVVNARIMTLFLWHLTAIVIVGGLAVASGLTLDDAGTAGWWAGRPIWVLLAALVLTGLVAAFGWAERAPSREAPRRDDSPWAGLAGVLFIARGLIGFATTGFEPAFAASGEPFLWMALSPVADLALIVLGYLLVQGLAAPRAAPDAASEAELVNG